MAWPVTGVGGWEKQHDTMRRICIKSASIRSLIGPGEHKMFRRRLGAEASGRQEGQRASRGRRGDGGHPRRRPALPFARKLVGGMYSCRGHTAVFDLARLFALLVSRVCVWWDIPCWRGTVGRLSSTASRPGSCACVLSSVGVCHRRGPHHYRHSADSTRLLSETLLGMRAWHTVVFCTEICHPCSGT